jgi:hypothetical protein
MNTDDIWVKVPGYEESYEITRTGDIRYTGSDSRAMRGRLKKTCIDAKGYVRVTLTKNGKNRQKLVHALLASAFLDKGAGDYVVDHIDGNPSNNDLSNLRWTNQSNNQLNRHKVVAKSGITGVHYIYNARFNPWRASGKLHGKIIHLGVFASAEDARVAREAWELSVGCTTSANIRRLNNGE